MDNDNVLTTVDLNTLAESIADQMGSLDLVHWSHLLSHFHSL